MSFDYQGARNEGYSDDEILDYLSQEHPDFDVKGAVNEGYSADDIFQHLSSEQTTQPQQIVEEGEPERYVSPPVPDYLKKTNEGKSWAEQEGFDEFSKRMEGIKTEVPKNHELSYADRLKWEEQVARAETEGQTDTLRSLVSGRTFGLSENVPGLKPKEGIGQEVGKLIGSLGPLTALTKAVSIPAQAIGKMSPILKTQVGHLLTAFGVGASDKALHQLAKGEVPSGVDAAEEGAFFAAVDLLFQVGGKGAKFAKGMFDYLKKGYNAGEVSAGTAKKVYEFVKPKGALKNQYEELIESMENRTPSRELKVTKVEPGEEISAADKLVKPSNRVEIRIADEAVQRLQNEKINLAEVSEPGPKDFTHQVEALEKSVAEESLNKVGQKKSVEQLGDDVQKSVNSRFAEDKKVYSDLYNEVKEGANQKKYIMIPTKPVETALDLFGKFMNLETKTAGERAALSSLKTIFNDMKISLDTPGPMRVSDMIDLASTINQTLGRPGLDRTARDTLGKVSSALKTDIKNFLDKFDQNLHAGYTMAEEEVARVHGIYNTPVMRQLRAAKTPEAVFSMIEKKPSIFGDVKKALSPTEFGAVERKVLEKMEGQNFKQARKMQQEFSPHMSDNGRRVADDIVKGKNPFNPHVQFQKRRKAVLDEVGNALLDGTRPKKTLDLWKTEKGRKLIQSSFRGNPSWGQVKKYLQDQSFHDVVKEMMTKEGTMDFKKLSEHMKDPLFRKDIRDLGGNDAVRFFENMERRADELTANLQVLEQTPTPTQAERVSQEAKIKLGEAKGKKVNEPSEHFRISGESSQERGKRILQTMASKDFPLLATKQKWTSLVKEVLGLEFTTATSIFGILKLGGGKFLGTLGSAGVLIANKWMDSLLTSPKSRRAFIKASQQTHDPLKVILALHGLQTAMEKEK